MSNDITTNAGRKVGEWSGESAEALLDELARIRDHLRSENSTENLIAKQMPHREQ